jgi:acetylornithine deacetylase/succinyl-diaminopimelate desuccinylase-like protein
MKTLKKSALLSLLSIVFLLSQVSSAQLDEKNKQLAHDIFKQLIEINTTDSVGDNTAAAEAMAQRLRDAGYPDEDIFVGGPVPKKGNLVARLRGTGKFKPVLLMGHLDVVEARRSDWSVDPFQFIEKEGYYYGRGTQDTKSGDAMMMMTMIRMKLEGFKPDRDIILILTADEEGGSYNGPDWLLKNHRDLVNAEYAINTDGGGVELENGKPKIVTVDATEKLYGDFQLKVTNPGGHSSIPTPDNAIYHLANALTKVQHYTFPFELNTVTRAYFERDSKTQTGQRAADMLAITKQPPDNAAIARLSADPILNSMMHTTCVATLLSGGHAHNALPQLATANVNCRILPGHSREEVRQELVRVIDDPKVAVGYEAGLGDVSATAPDAKQLAPPPLRPELMETLDKVSAEFFPGAPVIPDMATGASDGVYTNAAGIPTYALSGIAIERTDIRAHGRDERLGVNDYYKSVDFFYRLMKELTSK